MSSLMLRAAARSIGPVAVVVALYLLLRGHVSPGGGFVAAVVLGLAVLLRYWALGAGAVSRLLRLGPGPLVGIGLGTMLATGLAGWWWGGHFLEPAAVHLSLPIVGDVPLPSTLLFEIGVTVAVLAIVVAVVRELGREDDP